MTRRLPLAVALAASLAAAAAAQPAVPASEEKARELFRSGKFDDALKELQAAAKADPKRPPPRVTLAGLFFQARDGQRARIALEQAAAEDPNHPEVYLLNASFAYAEGRITDTVLSCQTALRLAADPRWDADRRKRFTREARLGLASAFEARRDWPAARDQLKAVLADEPTNGPARQRLAATLFHLNQPDAAFAELQTAARDDPATGLPELQMAVLYSGQNDQAKAEEWLKKAVAAHPKDAKAQRAYAGWLLDGGRLADAQAPLAEAARLDPADPDTVAMRGLAARYRKELPEAEKVFEGLARDHPNNAKAVWNLALVLADSSDAAKQRRAVELAEAEVRRNPQAPEGYAVYGWCLYRAGRLDDAERSLARAAQLGPLSRDAAYFLAKVLVDRGKLDDARKVLKSAADARGGYVYKDQADALLAEVEKKLPEKKDEKK